MVEPVRDPFYDDFNEKLLHMSGSQSVEKDDDGATRVESNNWMTTLEK